METRKLISVIEENGDLNECCLDVPVPGTIQQLSLSCDEQVVAITQVRNVKILSMASLVRATETGLVCIPIQFEDSGGEGSEKETREEEEEGGAREKVLLTRCV